MSHVPRVFLAGLVALAAPVEARAAERTLRMPSEEEIRKVEAAAPSEAPARPAGPRKVLVWGRLDAHDPNAIAARTFEILGRKSGAYEAVVSQEPADLEPERIRNFDALVMNNVHQPDPFLPADLKDRPAAEQEALHRQKAAIEKAILDFVGSGKGLVGVHAATAAFSRWPEYGELIGGYYGGHVAGEVTIRVEEPDHPLCAPFGGKAFKINDEIYIFKEPYSRQKVRVLLSLDLGAMSDPGKRPDRDYAVSWVKPYGRGRVFYCSLGHASATYWNGAVLRHLLAGVQFAIGDLKADALPRATEAAPKGGWQ